VIAPPTNNSGPSAPEAAPPSAGGSAASGTTGSARAGGMAGTSQSAQQNTPAVGAPESETQNNPRPPIDGNTKGVIGISDVKLESGSQNSQQGSVLTSEKNNVKIEKGTMLLLRVAQ